MRKVRLVTQSNRLQTGGEGKTMQTEWVDRYPRIARNHKSTWRGVSRIPRRQQGEEFEGHTEDFLGTYETDRQGP
jgi:hypothetical protein